MFGACEKRKFLGSSVATVRMDFGDLDDKNRFSDELLPFVDLKVWAGVILYFVEHHVIISVPPIRNDCSSTTIEKISHTVQVHHFACVDFFQPSKEREYFNATEDLNLEDDVDTIIKCRPATLGELWTRKYLPRGKHCLVPGAYLAHLSATTVERRRNVC